MKNSFLVFHEGLLYLGYYS